MGIDPAVAPGGGSRINTQELRQYSDHTGTLTVLGADSGEITLRLEPSAESQPWVLNATTQRPLPYIDVLVEQLTVDAVINEIYRETIVETKLHSILECFPLIESTHIKRILDFGCGAGASTNILGDLFPGASILGLDIDANLIDTAQRRSAILGRNNLRFKVSQDSVGQPDSDVPVDMILMNAVFEHLLPEERRELLPEIWGRVRPGGLLLLVETPHRWFPIEVHTTSLPLLNYLPDWLAHLVVRRFCRIFDDSVTWPALLRAGTRGGTVHEIVTCLAGKSGPEPEIVRSPTFGKRAQVDLWWHGDARRSPMKRRVFSFLLLLSRTTGIDWTPWITLVLRKPLKESLRTPD